MSRSQAVELARRGELYPSVILHGADDAGRQDAALELARTLLCQKDPGERPCGTCNQCRRIVWPGGEEELFHPDFQVQERDLKSSTSVDAVREFLKTAQVSPFEARGQVFVVASADSLTGEAANALLKTLEEPATSAPRHFLLLAPSQLDLLPTLRSRSLAIYLGAALEVDGEEAAALTADLTLCLEAFCQSRAAVHLLAAAGVLGRAGGFQDARSGRPWALAARALLDSLEASERLAQTPGLRRRALALAEALLNASSLRLRGIPAERILEGLLVRHLVADGWEGAVPPT